MKLLPINWTEVKIHSTASLVIASPMLYCCWQFYITENIAYVTANMLIYSLFVPGYAAFDDTFFDAKHKSVWVLLFYIFGYSLFRVHRFLKELIT